jgi:lipopolysaccharide export system permease protein
MFILWRHILRVHVAPFVGSFLLVMGVFLLQFLMKSLDQLAGKGLNYTVIAELIALSLAWMVVLAVPMGVLIATLMAFGNLASTNQVTAMRSAGVSVYRMMAPVVLASIGLCYGLFVFNNDVLPDSNHQLKNLTTDISHKKPTLKIVPGLFQQLMTGRTMLVRNSFESTNDLEGVTIFDYSKPLVNSTITAMRGTISFSQDFQKLILDLTDGEIHEQGLRENKQYRRIRFQTHRIALAAEGFEFTRTNESNSSRGDREMSAVSMMAVVDSLRGLQQKATERIASIRSAQQPPDGSGRLPLGGSSTSQPSSSASFVQNAVENEQMQIRYFETEARRYLVEIHKKYAIPVACIVFVLIGAPLGIMARRGTFGVSGSLSLGFFLIYWSCLIGGEKLADRGLLQPWVGMWIANILLGALGIYLTIRVAKENVSIEWNALARFVPKRFRSDAPPVQTAE